MFYHYFFSLRSLFQVMDSEIESKLKDAVEFYHQSDFVSCRELLGRVLAIDQKNYSALLLNGSCCDHLGLENIGVDYFYRAIQLDPDTVSAWEGLFQLGKKYPDRYHELLVCVCMKLLQFYKSPEFAEKKTACGQFLIELLIRYRLELPDGLRNLHELCRSVLKSAPSDSFALELSIRLKAEMFIVTGLPRLVSPTLLNSPLEGNGFTKVVDDFLSSETSVQLKDLEDSMKRPYELSSQTVAVTFQLGAMIVAAGQLLSKSDEHARVGWQGLLEQIDMVELSGCRGLSNWLQQGYMDLHVTCLHALVAYQLHLFDHCEMVLDRNIFMLLCAPVRRGFQKQPIAYAARSPVSSRSYMILTYCSQKKTTAAQEARLLSLFPTTPLSHRHGSLTSRPMCIPVRLLPSDLPLDLSETSRSTYGLIEEWATGLRLANAAASEQVIFASQLALELAAFCDELHRGTFVWPSVLQTLLVECFLVGRCLKHAFRVLCSVEWDALNVHILRALVSDNPYQSAVRLRLCGLWAATEFMIQSATLHDQTQSVLAKFADIAHTVAGSLQSLCTARDHFLLARLFSLLDSASGGCLPGVSKMVQLEHYEAGVAADEAYYVNHLFLGRLRREGGNVEEALLSLYRAHELMPSSPEVTYQLALALCQNNELVKALDVYNSLDQNHFSKHMWIHYGLIAMRLKVSSLCVTALQKVVMLDSENALYWELLGETYLLRGSYKTALRALTRSNLLDPTRPLAQIRFGQACRRLGDFELAIKHIASGLDCAFSQGQMKSVGHVVLLALQELIEINLLVARAYLRDGLLGSAVEKFQSLVKYLDQAFDMCSSLKQPPLWIYHYAASAFSLFNGIDDVDFR
ncbi:hypothetical protein EG68_06411 [Paragonimus skrjabini miyazakii]|uniref:Uncharacterized protein n=1 Tax=Paragonimus skrjabini miyazakii TaxID=59628 RepID=A0A8S9YTA0_9TREM|nr:hypothetical protein EG68_06411 [Paragonimus skrjabini miyazakii]